MVGLGMRAILDTPHGPDGETPGEAIEGTRSEVVKRCKEAGGHIPCESQAAALKLAKRLGASTMFVPPDAHSVLFHPPGAEVVPEPEPES
jgi:hypothetical protein